MEETTSDRQILSHNIVSSTPPMQSVPITTEVVSLNPAHGEVYSIQHYVIKFFSDLRQVGGFLRHSGFLHQYYWNIVETGVKHHNSNPKIQWGNLGIGGKIKMELKIKRSARWPNYILKIITTIKKNMLISWDTS